MVKEREVLSWPQGRRSWWPFLPEKRKESKTRRIVGGGPWQSAWSSRTMPPPGRWVWGCRMIGWKKSTGEASICRTKSAGANLTYLFATSENSEGVQVDMVTVRTVIKGLRRWFDTKRSWFWRYLTVQNLQIGSSAVLSNGNVADECVLERFGSRSWEIRGTCRRIKLRLFGFGDWLPIRRSNYGKTSLLRRIWEH